jgi:preprotein translocase subunit SecA
MTESEEFHKIYRLDVVTIPTNRAMVRQDFTDYVFRSQEAKYGAVVGEIYEMYQGGRPVLVGTTSVESSEKLSRMLQKYDIPHNVLNAKLHEKESTIVAQAGRPHAVTIATNMAGRGTDIILGGSPESYLEEVLQERELTDNDRGTEAYQEALEEADRRWQVAHDQVIELGGLHIIGTERHESRRIDNQLRGRAGRQGDPGRSRFYVALDDELMRRFGSERIGGLLERFGFDENTPIENGLITKTIEQAQTKVEGLNFDFRKHLVEYDDVMNRQRDQIYKDRRRILSAELENLKSQILSFTEERMTEIVEEYTQGEHAEWDLPKIIRNVGLLIQTKPLSFSTRPKDEEEMEHMVLEALEAQLGVTVAELEGKNKEDIISIMYTAIERVYEEKHQRLGDEDLVLIIRIVMRETMDENWVNYLTPMEMLRQGIGLRSYAQQDPLVAYKTSAFKMFNELQGDIKRTIVQRFWSAELQKTPVPPQRQMVESGPSDKADSNGRGGNGSKPQPVRRERKLGPNDPCFCGSGKKYKKCHGTMA